MDDTGPLLPDGRYQGHYQEQAPRQSSRAQSAARYNATPDGEYMTSKREAFKNLQKNPKQFLGEAIGAELEGQAQQHGSRPSRSHHDRRPAHTPSYHSSSPQDVYDTMQMLSHASVPQDVYDTLRSSVPPNSHCGILHY
jgi:hypothetical protein